MKNIIYFYNINAIGGVETYLYQIAKKYKDLDITVYYSKGDINQIKRLKKYIRVKKFNNERIKCDKAFFNIQSNIIDYVDAKDYSLVVHGDIKDMIEKRQMDPVKIDPRINHIYGVSKKICESVTKVTGRQCELLYNPYTKEKPERVLRLISATRLTKEKGGERIIALANELNKQEIKFIWEIFTDSPNPLQIPNVKYMKQKIDITNYIAKSDMLIQLSDSEGYCYSVVEALSMGIPVVVTPCPVFEEIGLNENNSIKLEFNCSNIKEVVEQIKNKTFNFTYDPPEDEWGKIFEPGESTYKEERNMKYEVEALNTYEELKCTDVELKRIPKEGERFIVTKDRLDTLLGENNLKRIFVKVIKEIKDDLNTAIEETKADEEEIVQAVAEAIKDTAEEENKKVEEVVEEIVKEAKTSRKATKKK